jgi:hypothetical protein
MSSASLPTLVRRRTLRYASQVDLVNSGIIDTRIESKGQGRKDRSYQDGCDRSEERVCGMFKLRDKSISDLRLTLTHRRNSVSPPSNATPSLKDATCSEPVWRDQSSPELKCASLNKKAVLLSVTAAPARVTTKSASSWLSTPSSHRSRSLHHGVIPSSSSNTPAVTISSTMLRSTVLRSRRRRFVD